MKKFNYYAPKTLDECSKLFQTCEFPQYIAGGMTLLPSIKQGLSSPTDLIDLTNINKIKDITSNDKLITIGCLATHNEVAHSKLIKKKIPGLAYLASKIADNAVRNKGTIGGSICNADPAADYPSSLLSLDANIHTNLREINARNFFVDMFETALEDGEIVTSVSIPEPEFSFYEKFSSQASKYAIVGVFLSVSDRKASIAITGASNKVFLLEELENKTIDELRKFNLDDINFNKYDINSDINASVDYRVSLIKSLVTKSINNFIYE